MTSGKERTEEEVKEIVEGLGYYLIGEYSYKNLRKVFIQDKFGYKYLVNLNALMDGHEPEKFRHTNPFSLENISLWLIINGKNFELGINKKYINNANKLYFNCYVCGETFQAGWNQILRGDSCGICAGSQVGKYNNLEYLRPDLAKEWGLENKILPNQVTISSGYRAFWVCSKCKYKWKTRVADRTGSKKGCAACAGQVLTDLNRLSIRFPKISSEWHPIKNGDLTPNDFSYGINKRVWWLCSKCDFEWKSTINNRTNANINSGCPACANKQKESKIATGLKKYFLSNYYAEEEYKILKNPETGNWLPYDLYLFGGKIPEINGIYIEVHWNQHYRIVNWHKQIAKKKGTTPEEEFKYQKKKDKMKKNFSRKNGIYIEIDLRKIKDIETAILYIENKIKDIIEKDSLK